MSLLHDILAFNEQFVATKEYEKYRTTKFPDKRLVVISCMDTRLVELLPRAMNLKNGDVKIIKTAGAIVSHPFGSVMRSILVAIYELNAQEVCVIGHYDCGMSSINVSNLADKAIHMGIPAETLTILKRSGIRLEKWLKGFDNVVEAVSSSVELVRNHPLLPAHIPVHGLIIDPESGKLDLVVDGNQYIEADS